MFERSADLCAAAVARGAAPSVSLAVAVRGVVVFANAWGLADVAAGRTATVDTAYLLASVTKPLTATAVCALADRGVFALDDPVTAHLPWLRLTPHRDAGPPTVRHLLGHTAGLGLHLEFAYPEDRAPVPSLADSVARYGHLFHPPGRRFAYTNLGYGILDALLAAACGAPAGGVLDAEVFAPLGMRTAWVGPRYAGGSAAAVPHTVAGRAYPPYDTTHRGASLGWASAPDVALFGQSLLGEPGPLSSATRALMRTPRLPGSGYGLGLAVTTVAGRRAVGHDGRMGGVATALLAVPDLRASVAVLTNSLGPTAGEVARSAIGELAGGPVNGGPVAGGSVNGAEAGTGPTRVSAGLHGTRWRGTISAPDERLTLELDIAPDGSVLASVAGGRWQPALLEPSYHTDPRTDVLARLPDALPLPGAARSPRTFLALERAGDRLLGAVRAEPLPDDRHGWFGNCFSHWCELDAAPPSPGRS